MRRLRVARGLSQERLAVDGSIDRAYIGGLEREEANPTVDLLDRLAGALGVPIAALFVEPRKGARPPQPLRRGRKKS